MTPVRVLLAAIALAHAPAMAQQSYSKAVADANAIYGSSALALSPNGRWLAFVADSAVRVVPAGGGAQARVPLPGPHACGMPVWDEQSAALAMPCTPARGASGTPVRTLYVWRRGAADVSVAATNVLSVSGWLPSGRGVVYLGSVPRSAPATSVARPPSQPRDSSGSCVPASVRGVSETISVACSDTVDVMRSTSLHRLLSGPGARNAYSASATPRPATDTTRAVYRSSSQLRVADLDRSTTSLLYRLDAGMQHEVRVAGGGRIGVVQADSFGIRQGRTVSWYSAFTVGTEDSTQSRTMVAAEADLRLWTGNARSWAPDRSAFAWRPQESLDTATVDSVYIASVGASVTAVAIPRAFRFGKRLDVRAPDVLSGEESSAAIKWTPDGTRLVLSAAGNLAVLNRDGSGVRSLSEATEALPVAGVLLSTNTELLVTTLDPATGLRGLWWVRLADARWRKAADLAFSMPARSMQAALDGAVTTVAFVASLPNAPQNIYTIRVGTAGRAPVPLRLTDARVSVALPAIRDTVLSFAVSPSFTAHARLFRPANATGPLATIVFGYPGGLATMRSRYSLERVPGTVTDVYEAIGRGYAFLHLDVPVPPFGLYGERGPAGNIVAAFSAALDAAARSGWIDTTRLGVVGHSFGGYMVNTLVARMPTRFRAAVAMSGLSDYVSGLYGGTAHGVEWYSRLQGGMEAEFRDDPMRYLENSPVRYLENVRTPLLLLHGVQDPFVSVSQAEEMFRGLAQLGRPVELVRYQKSGHGPDARWWERTLNWFDAFLK